MIVVDAHQDIAMNVLAYGRDYRRAALATRRLEADNAALRERAGVASLGLPDALLGRVAVAFATLFTAPARSNDAQRESASYHRLHYSTPREAYQIALEQWDVYQRLADDDQRVRLVATQSALDAVLATWANDKSTLDHVQGLVLLMENADAILEPKQFEEWYERGVRIVGPAWQASRYAAGTGAPGGLTALGRDLLDVMAGFNAILDLSHMAEAAYLEAVDRYEGVIIASHSNPRRFRTTDRHLSDDMIRRLAERDGVMGIVLYNSFLSNSYTPGDARSKYPLTLVLDAIDYVCQLTGSAAHVGIGSDLDGGFGAEATPDGIDTVTDLWTLGGRLRERGYSPDDVRAILGDNWLRQLRRALPPG